MQHDLRIVHTQSSAVFDDCSQWNSYSHSVSDNGQPGTERFKYLVTVLQPTESFGMHLLHTSTQPRWSGIPQPTFFASQTSTNVSNPKYNSLWFQVLTGYLKPWTLPTNDEAEDIAFDHSCNMLWSHSKLGHLRSKCYTNRGKIARGVFNGMVT